jgi:Holliday junction resolvase RusA-like endonuclease
MIIVLPWLDPKLSPNARVHWTVLSHAKKKARRDAAFAALEALQGRKFAGGAVIPFKVTFCPPDARHRDDDNMVASFKAYRDGIADALGVNDRQFSPEYVFADPCKPGRVEVEIIPAIHGEKALPDSAFVLEQSGPQCCDNSTAGLTKANLDRRLG